MKAILRPKLVADLTKDYGALWSDKKPTAKAAIEVRNDAIGSAEGKRIGNYARQKRIRYRNQAARGRRRFTLLLHV